MSELCSIELLESALAGSLPPDKEEMLQQHLDQCEACSAAIERLAGCDAFCKEAAVLLTEDAMDEAATREDWSAVDFGIEFLDSVDDPKALGSLGGYQVLEIIGRGGMGFVLKAFDLELRRYVAIKALAPHLAQSPLARKRFAREAQAAAAIVHPHVVAIHHVQSSGRLPFLVMPLIVGESLAERLKSRGTLDLKEVLRIGMQAAAGLAAAHDQGIVHRDVKPANIMLEKGVERAVLTDFGLAQAADDVTLTRCGIIAGTPQYMSPEQAQGKRLDGRSDLFSLGCVLYEMAAGVSPFRADSTMATLRRLVDDRPQDLASLNPELPPWFNGIVERLLEKDPARRFDSAKEVSELLEKCLAHLQQPATVPLPRSVMGSIQSRPASRRKMVLRLIGTMGAVIGMGLMALVMTRSPRPPDNPGKWTGEEWGQGAPDRHAEPGSAVHSQGQGRPIVETRKRQIPESIRAIVDLPYAETDNPRQRLDLYLPKQPFSGEPLPVVAVIHGNYEFADKQSGLGFAAVLVPGGDFAVISIGYRLSDEAQWPAQIHDCKAAIRWVRANAETYNLDPDHIGVIGPSAGGHLAALLGTTGDVAELEGTLGQYCDVSSRVTCVVDLFGPTDLLTLGGNHDLANSAESRLIGGPLQEMKDVARQASATTWVTGDTPPFLIIHGTNDPIVPFQQSELLAAALREFGASAVLIPVAGGGHGNFRNPEVARRYRRFFRRYLRGQEVAISTQPIEQDVKESAVEKPLKPGSDDKKPALEKTKNDAPQAPKDEKVKDAQKLTVDQARNLLPEAAGISNADFKALSKNPRLETVKSDLFAGRIPFVAQATRDGWVITEFRLPHYKTKVVRGKNGVWEQQEL